MKTFRQYLNEEAPPDPKIEAWIKDNKERFKKKYGEKYKEVLYGRAWKMYNAKEQINEQIELKNSFSHKNIDRKDMPQIKASENDKFIRMLKDEHNIETILGSIRLNNVKFTQKDIDFDKVMRILENIKEGENFYPVLISSDNHILDGHHRTLAYILINKAKQEDYMPAQRIKGKISDLLKIANGENK